MWLREDLDHPFQSSQGPDRARAVPLGHDDEGDAVPCEDRINLLLPFQLHESLEDVLSEGGEALSNVQAATPQSGLVSDEPVGSWFTLTL